MDPSPTPQHPHPPLLPRQLAFADAVARGATYAAAARAAGYSTRSTGSRLIRDPRVQAHITAVRERLAAELDAETIARLADAAAPRPRLGTGSGGGPR